MTFYESKHTIPLVQNKQAIIGIVAAAIILLGAGGVFLYSKNKPAAEPSSTTTVTQVTKTPSESMMSASLKDLFAGGKTSQCTFDVKGAIGETKGTVYVADTKAYGEFGTTTNGKTTTTHLIRNADTFYVWGDSIPTGMKMTMSVDEMASKMQGSAQYKDLDPNQKTDYKCSGWTVDSSVFVPPSNIKFTDLGGMMKTTVKPSGANCSVCNSLTGDVKNACLSQLGC